MNVNATGCLWQEGDKKSGNDKSSSARPTTTQALSSTGGATPASKAAAAGGAKPSPIGVQKESKEMVLSRLMKLEPKELMKEIVSGHVPLSMLNQVASRLPAEMLQEAVDFLSKSDSETTAQQSEPSSHTQPCEHLPLRVSCGW